jgi:hypothetical protein
MKTYTYAVFLKHPITNHCITQEIEVDTTSDYLSAIELFEKLEDSGDRLFEDGYTLIVLNVTDMQEG